MNSKVVIAIVAVVIVAVAGIAFFAMSSNNGGDAPSDGILYDGNGGKLSDGKTTYTQHSTSVDTCSFQKDGYHWVVWNTKADGSGTDYNENSVAPAKTTLYAQWSNANTIFGTDGGIGYVSIFVADSNGGKEVNIDHGYAELPSKAVFIIKPLSGVTLKIYVDGKGVIAEKSDKKNYIEYITGTAGIVFENGSIKDDGSAVFEVRQTISNQSVTLGCLNTSVSNVLDIKGTREVPTDIMNFSIKYTGLTDVIDINHTGSVQLGDSPEIHVKAVKTGTSVDYDADAGSIIFTLDGKKYEIQFNFSNGGEVSGVSINEDTAIIKFLFDHDKDPIFYRVIGS